jgi:hypothetical protein
MDQTPAPTGKTKESDQVTISIDVVCDDCEEGFCTGMETIEEARECAKLHGWTTRACDNDTNDLCPDCVDDGR